MKSTGTFARAMFLSYILQEKYRIRCFELIKWFFGFWIFLRQKMSGMVYSPISVSEISQSSFVLLHYMYRVSYSKCDGIFMAFALGQNLRMVLFERAQFRVHIFVFNNFRCVETVFSVNLKTFKTSDWQWNASTKPAQEKRFFLNTKIQICLKYRSNSMKSHSINELLPGMHWKTDGYFPKMYCLGQMGYVSKFLSGFRMETRFLKFWTILQPLKIS